MEINTGNTAWLLLSSALVLLMTPGLALFYGGLNRSKGVLNMMMMSFVCIGLVSILWIIYGFTLAFGVNGSAGLNNIIGSFTYFGTGTSAITEEWLFFGANTGIPTYIWVLSNRKPKHRRGYVQLIDATQWFTPLRKNLGNKNCELSDADIRQITDAFLGFEETEESKILPNAGLGYQKVTVERPLRLVGIDAHRVYSPGEIKKLRDSAEPAEEAPPVIRRIHSRLTEPDPVRGLFSAFIGGKPAVVEYEQDPDLRDTEQVPLLEEGGIEAFMRREVLPYAPDAWYVPDSIKAGYEITFTRYFYRPKPMRSLDEIRADILALERETEGLLEEIVGTGR